MADKRLQELEAEWLALESEAEAEDDHGGVPEAGEAEADNGTVGTDSEPVAAVDKPAAVEAGVDDKPGQGGDAAEPTGDDVPDHQKYAEARRKARKFERQMHAADAKREVAERELAEMKAQLEYAKSRGADIPPLPSKVDVEAVRSGDPDAIADALEFILRGGGQVSDGGHQQARQGSAVADAVADKAAEAVPASFEEFLDSLPTSSEVHKLGQWADEKPVLFEMAKQAERLVFAAPENQGKTLETLYTEVVRRVEQQARQQAEAAFKPVDKGGVPRSLSAVAGVSQSPQGSLAEQFMGLGTAEQVKFYQGLSQRQRDQLDMELEAA